MKFCILSAFLLATGVVMIPSDGSPPSSPGSKGKCIRREAQEESDQSYLCTSLHVTHILKTLKKLLISVNELKLHANCSYPSNYKIHPLKKSIISHGKSQFPFCGNQNAVNKT